MDSADVIDDLLSEWWESPVDVRDLFAEAYRDLDDDEVDDLVHEALGEDISLDDVEQLYESMGQAGQAMLQALPTILPILGTALGAFGGPAGAALGGTLGGAAGQAVGAATAKRPARAPARRGARAPARPAAAPSAPAPPPGTEPSPAAPIAAPAAGVPAAAQLMSVVLRPETLQALLAMMLGGLGRPDVMVGTTPVPVGAFTDLLGVLAQQASAQSNGAEPGHGEAVPEYLTHPSGSLKCDPALAEHRASVLLGMLNAELEADADAEDEGEWWEDDDMWEVP